MLDWIIQRLILLLLKCISATYRVSYKNPQHFDQAIKQSPNKSLIFALWHEQLWSGIVTHSHKNYFSAASRSKDGDYAAFIAKGYGLQISRGSSRSDERDKGGAVVLSQSEQFLRQGVTGGLTVDGPKGPRRKTKKGVILLSMQTQSPIVGLVVNASPSIRFNSWDRFQFPLPFAKIIVNYAAPITPPHTPESWSHYAQQLDEVMLRLEEDLQIT